MALKKSFRPLIFWIIIFSISLSVRYWYSSTELCFYTDQSRDAIVANQILQGSLKLFGPVVNSRGAIFHGVLYYYVIAPLYAVGGGSPLFVSIALSLISTIGLIPTYFLAEKLLKSKRLAYIVIAMLSVSVSSVETSASFWNLQLSIIFLPAFCLFLLKTYDKFALQNSFFTGLLLGLLIQSGFSNIQWLLPYVAVFGALLCKQLNKRRYFKNLTVSLLGLGIATSSMILVEFLSWRRGLFAMEDALHWVGGSGFSIQNIQSVFSWYFKSLNSFLIPQVPLVTIVIITVACLVIYQSRKDRQWLWLGLLLITPVGGQIASNSVASYILTGYESIFYIFIVLVFYKIFQYLEKKVFAKSFIKSCKAVVLILLTIFMISNITMLRLDKITKDTLACAWRISSFEELQLIDYTYQLADNEPFSIDVITEPYGINMKYGYLYSWYGQNKYGYAPVFVGGTQTGHITEGLLKEAESFLPKHFIIYEPGSYNYWFKVRTIDAPATRQSQDLFYYRQPPLDKLQETQQFGELIKLDYYLTEFVGE